MTPDLVGEESRAVTFILPGAMSMPDPTRCGKV